jgi:class 3 adenylate cyclase
MAELAAWLEALGLGAYTRRFADSDIGLDDLPGLTDEHLRELGVSVGHRIRLRRALAALDAGAGGAGPSSAQSTRAAASEPSAERRLLTVLFCDLVGSTALSVRLDPEDLREIITAYQRCCADTVERFGGFIARYMGDGVLAYFGYPYAHEDDPERAILAGLSLIEAVAGLRVGERLQARVGIATGTVVVGDLIGEGASRERGVVGETPNLASRLQSLAEPDQLVIASTTRRLARDTFRYRRLERVMLKGFAEPVEAWQVLGASAAESRFEAHHETLAPLVGRSAELDLLLQLWRKTCDGQGQVVLLSGEPGIGKSRAIRALRERLARERHVHLSYFCSAHRRDSPLYPIETQLARSAGFISDDTPGDRLVKLKGLLGRSRATSDQVALIAELLSLPGDARQALAELSPQVRKEKTFDALLTQVASLAARQPVLMTFEDAHWIDPTSRELLDLAIARVKALPAMLVISFRPEAMTQWPAGPHVAQLALGRLGRGEAAALIDQATEDRPLPKPVVDEILARSDGVPLFIEELTRSVLEARRSAPPGGPAAAADASLDVPISLHASLMARLDRLGAAKEIAQIGAAIGREFSFELVSAVADRPETELCAALDSLVEAGIVSRRGTPPRASCLFKHALVRDAAYGTLLRDRRRSLHLRIGRTLEAGFGDLVETQPDLLAHHFMQAGSTELAVLYLGKAGRNALARSAMTEAAAQLRKALELLPQLPDGAQRHRQELTLQIALGNALIAATGYTAPETGRVYQQARVLAEQLADTPNLIHVAHGEWSFHLMRGEIERAMSVAEDVLGRALQQDGPELRLAAHRFVGATLLQSGRLKPAREHLGAALDLMAACGRDQVTGMVGGRDALVGVPAYLAIALALSGSYEPAREQAAASIAEAKREARPHRLAFALGVAGCWFHGLMNEDAPELLETFAALSAEQSFPFWAAHALEWRGLVRARFGDPSGLALVREGASRHMAMGAIWGLPFYFGTVAEWGGGDAAPGLVEDALRQVETTGERWIAPELQRIKGEVLLARFGGPAAETCFAAAIAEAREQGSRHWELRAALSLARLRCDQGRDEEARRLLDLCDWFPSNVQTSDLQQARVLRDELGALNPRPTGRPPSARTRARDD